MSLELLESIERLYKVFADYPANPKMDGSPMYHELAAWNRALMAKPLRELSAAEDLRIYHFKAMTTWGDVKDFKHFLPRIFELLTTLPPDFEEWVALGKLHYGHYETWPALEQTAIHQFLLAFWQMLLSQESVQIDAVFGDYFSAIANIYPNFKQLLQLWEENKSQQAAQHLAIFCLNTKKIFIKRVLPGIQDSAPLGEQFFNWLHSAPALVKLKQAKPSDDDPYLDLQIAPIIEQLEQQ
jgi:hypothetical protein